MTSSEDGIGLAIGITLVLSILLLIVTYMYDKERGAPSSQLVIPSNSIIELEQFDPMIPSIFYIDANKTESHIGGNIIARLAVTNYMRSHKPLFNRGYPNSLPREINHVFIHPSWMPWLAYSFGEYLAWTYRMVPNHMIVGSIRDPWQRHQTKNKKYFDLNNFLIGNNLICAEIGIRSLTSIRTFIMDQKYLLSQWLTRTKASQRMTGLIIWIDYDNLDKSLLIFRKWIGLKNFNDIYYLDKNKQKKTKELPTSTWISQNNLDIELYNWVKELNDTLLRHFYPNGYTEELSEYKVILKDEYADNKNDIIFMDKQDYQKLVLNI